MKNKTALQLKVFKELVSWYAWTDEKGRTKGSHVPYDYAAPKSNKEVAEKWVFAHDVLKS